MKLNTQGVLWFFVALLLPCLSAGAQILPQVTRPPAKTTTPKTATPKTTQIVIQTSPEAQVYLDDVFKGQAGSQGRLVIENPKSGDHSLRVALAGKKGFEQQVTVTTGQVVKVNAVLTDISKPETPNPVATPSTVVIETSPGAQVYLDDTFKGQASPQGRLVIENPKTGDHSLRVTLAGKKDDEQHFTVMAGQTTNVRAALVDTAGSIRVQTSAGAEVFLDSTSRGTADGAGGLVVADVAPGAHELRVGAPNKKDYRQTIDVSGGREARVEAKLQDLSPTENPAVAVLRRVEATPQDRGRTQDGVGTVYFIFDQKFLGHIPVYCDGTLLAEFAGHKYFAARITPGRHFFKLKWGGTMALEIEAGGRYYLRMIKDDRVELVPEEAGRALFAKNHPLDATEFKDPRAFVPSF